jgi:hypothetical protein
MTSSDAQKRSFTADGFGSMTAGRGRGAVFGLQTAQLETFGWVMMVRQSSRSRCRVG